MQETKLRLKTTRVFEKNYKSTAAVVANEGGARSSKSWSILQLFIVKLVSETGKNFLITRKTMPALRTTAYKFFIGMLDQYKVPYKWNKAQNVVQVNGNYVLLTGIDDEGKVKSTEWDYVFMEEANDFAFDDFMILDMRSKRIFLAFNPDDPYSWIYEELEGKRDDFQLIHSTYLDNPFIDPEIRRKIESYREIDERHWQVYGLGQRTSYEGNVYTNWDICREWPETFDETIYGIDFGFNNPTALIQINFKDGEVYERQIIYESGLTNDALIEKMKEAEVTGYVYADSEDPKTIEDLYSAGFNVWGANKTKDSVKAGILSVKSRRVHIHPDSVNLIKEKKNYKWEKDKNGKYGDKPVKFLDHAMDAERYALFMWDSQRRPDITPAMAKDALKWVSI